MIPVMRLSNPTFAGNHAHEANAVVAIEVTAMCRVILYVASAVLVAAAVQPATADDASLCQQATGEEAIAACTRMLALNPKNAVVFVVRGVAYFRRGDYDDAISDYERAIRLDPKLAVAYNDRGDAYNHKGDYDRAISDYEQAIRLDPKLAIAYNNRGDAYNHKGDYDRAISDYEQAIRLDPKLAIAYNNRGDAYRHKGDYDHAISDYEQAIRLDPKLAIAYNNRGESYHHKGDYDHAISDYDEGIRRDPKLAMAYNNRGDAYRDKGDYNHAISDYDEAIRLDPKLAIAYNNRGDAYHHKGDHDHAVADFDQALNLAQHPNDAVLGTSRKVAPSAPSVGFAAQPVAATPAAQSPNGSSSVNETYGGWIINCRLVDGQKKCLLILAQGNSQTRQRIFEIDLQPPRDGKIEGTILMPFGLKLDSGALLTLDEKDFGPGLRFSTCVPEGCMLPVSWQTAAVDALKKAKALTVASLNLDNGEVVAFNVSLDGFASAIARIEELDK
jgi:tetratricopeptide (TPR) repeat protein/invasion protein IalB